MAKLKFAIFVLSFVLLGSEALRFAPEPITVESGILVNIKIVYYLNAVTVSWETGVQFPVGEELFTHSFLFPNRLSGDLLNWLATMSSSELNLFARSRGLPATTELTLRCKFHGTFFVQQMPYMVGVIMPMGAIIRSLKRPKVVSICLTSFWIITWFDLILIIEF